MFGLVELEFRLGILHILHILSCLVNVWLHTENWLCNLPVSALKVSLGGWLESEYSDRLWLSFILALAKPGGKLPKTKLNWL